PLAFFVRAAILDRHLSGLAVRAAGTALFPPGSSGRAISDEQALLLSLQSAMIVSLSLFEGAGLFATVAYLLEALPLLLPVSGTAHVKSPGEYDRLYQQGADDLEGFWALQARPLTWAKPFDRVLEWNEPHAKWFTGGQLNVSANCLDRHLSGPRRDKPAI